MRHPSFPQVLLLSALFLAPVQDPPAPPPVEEATLGEAAPVHRAGELWLSGQFAPADVEVLRERGIRRVITTRVDGEIDWDERALVEAAGMEFVAVPFRGTEALTDEVFDRVRALLRADAGPTLLHCASSNRVGGVWLPYRVLDQGAPLEAALAEAAAVGLRTEGYRERALDYIERRREPEVREDLNDSFADPELDVDAFVQRFEVESREVYAARRALLAATGARPGMRVADVGAGTGLFTFLFADAVGAGGAEGWVFAVDIAPRFLERIRSVAAERGTGNVTGVLCPVDSVALPPESVDLAYVCDTYHHFERPLATTRSILRALRPGGRLVVVDFERIPGVSREWILGHVRAGKDEVREEILRSGFEFVREIDVEGLEENYVLEFRKPAG